MSNYSHWYEDDETPHAPEIKTCEADGCEQAGEYRAPKHAPQDGLDTPPPNEFFHFCLEHVKEYNKKWNYFANMKNEEVDRFRSEAVTGHRPTWRMGHAGNGAFTAQNLEAKLYQFMRGGSAPKKDPTLPTLKGKTRKLMAVLDIEWPFDETSVKRQYKALVKKHHPDVNQGKKDAAEHFKRITHAYHELVKAIKEDKL